MGLLAVKQLASAAEYGNDRYALNRSVVFLGDIEVLVPLADIDVYHVVVLIDQGRDIGLVKSVIEGEAIKAPVCSKNEKHAFVILRRGLEGLRDFFVSIRVIGIEFAEPRRDPILSQRGLLRCQQDTANENEELD